MLQKKKKKYKQKIQTKTTTTKTPQQKENTIRLVICSSYMLMQLMHVDLKHCVLIHGINKKSIYKRDNK